MKRTLLITTLLIAIAALLSNCTQSGLCEGSLTLENPIPDVTVAVGDTLFIDLSNPPVFVSSEGEVTYVFIEKTGNLNIDLNRIANPNDEGNFTLLEVSGLAEGNASAKLTAYSGCLENYTTFKITITES